MAYITGKFETLGSNFRHDFALAKLLPSPATSEKSSFTHGAILILNVNFIIAFEEKGLLAVA